MRFIFVVLLYSAIVLVCSVAIFGCATAPTPTTPTCDALVGSTATAAAQAGFRLAQTQAGPAGEMAAFVRGNTARLIYVAPAISIGDYLVTAGWTKVGECSANASTYTVLQRDIEMPLQASPT